MKQTNNTYVVGQCVSLPRPKYLFACERTYQRYKASNKQLSKKDILRGFYYDQKGEATPLDQVLIEEFGLNRGKCTQPITYQKWFNITWDSYSPEPITTYIRLRGLVTKVSGVAYKGQLYFSGLSNEYYKTKLYVSEKGYVLGVNVTLLSDKKIKQCFNVFDDEVLSKSIGFEIINKENK